MRRFLNLRLISLLTILWTTAVIGQDAAIETAPPSDDRSADRSKIEAAIESYVAAFNAKDVDKLVSYWSEEGVYLSRTSGETLTGRDQLKEEFAAILSAENAPTLAVETESIEFISPNVALERGAAVVTRGDSINRTSYQVVYVEEGEDWLIDRVTEDEVIVKASNYEHLQKLEFLVGQWIQESEGTTIELDCEFTTNQNFLSRKYKVSSGGQVDSSGLQIIGWDAKEKLIRSWLFDSDGGFVKGEWSSHDDIWVVQSVATLADGASGSSTSIYRPIDADSFGWRKINRVLDGNILPNTDEVIVRRR
jgi:uncharacterized protein (TIGR02246 family)